MKVDQNFLFYFRIVLSPYFKKNMLPAIVIVIEDVGDPVLR